jgi:hypothetical protein
MLENEWTSPIMKRTKTRTELISLGKINGAPHLLLTLLQE